MLTKNGALNILHMAICDSAYAKRTGRPQPIFGLRQNNDVKIFVIDEEIHDIRDISGIVAAACGMTWDDKSGYIRVNSGYCPITYVAELLSELLNVKHIPAKKL